jgi:hypothetical protein
MDVRPYATLCNTIMAVFKIVEWDDGDAISHETLRMRITNVNIPDRN